MQHGGTASGTSSPAPQTSVAMSVEGSPLIPFASVDKTDLQRPPSAQLLLGEGADLHRPPSAQSFDAPSSPRRSPFPSSPSVTAHQAHNLSTTQHTLQPSHSWTLNPPATSQPPHAASAAPFLSLSQQQPLISQQPSMSQQQ
eukprot:Sspe_Gene.5760::Locus_1912_Transcript_1_1_Confidence_1.000_Length_460::g.5760::m.5760